MDSSSSPAPATGLLSALPRWQQWALLLGISVLVGGGLEMAGFPAALLVGPMVVGAVLGIGGATIRMPQSAFVSAQSVVGCLVAASLSPAFLPAFATSWPVLIASVLTTLAASSLLGWLISHWRILPGTTAVWGSAPGAASAMVLMAGAFGADQRLVAFMQYYRVILVTATAAIIARFWVAQTEGSAVVWFPPLEWSAFGVTIAVVIAGPVIGRLLRLPSPQFIGTLVLAIALKVAFGLHFQLPEWLLAISYATVGWTIGLRFDRQTISQIRRSLLQITASIIVLIAICGAIAFALAEFAGIDPLTAYLATSPGGMDSVAIIAAAADNVDLSFIMALQMLRFLLVLLAGPRLARFVAGHVKT